MSNNFYVGQKVVCVDDSSSRVGHIPHGLIKGRVYTLAAVGLVHSLDKRKLACVRLVEKPEHTDGVWAHRFRPAVDKPCDISVFTKMLTPTQKERVT